MYNAVADPYCYPDTTVLINKLDLRDQAKLDAFEAEGGLHLTMRHR
jgi:cell filamentation protein